MKKISNFIKLVPGQLVTTKWLYDLRIEPETAHGWRCQTVRANTPLLVIAVDKVLTDVMVLSPTGALCWVSSNVAVIERCTCVKHHRAG